LALSTVETPAATPAIREAAWRELAGPIGGILIG